MSFLAAIRFLTILPVGKSSPSPEELGKSQVFFPLVGLLLGGILAGIDFALTDFLPIALISALLIAILVVLTGAIHLEGFLDACDGLFGGNTPEQRLRIMREHHIGAYGLIGGICLILIKWSALFSLAQATRIPAIILFPALSRWGMVLAIYTFPCARKEGLGMLFHQSSSPIRTMAAGVTAFLASFILAGAGGILLFIVVSFLSGLMGKLATRLIGGLTGDIYGAINEVGEMVVLLLSVALSGLMSPFFKPWL